MEEPRKRPESLFADRPNHLLANYAIASEVLKPFVPQRKLLYRPRRIPVFKYHSGWIPAFTKRNFDAINLRSYVNRFMPRNNSVLRTATASAGQLRIC